jgi:hypothetical protein
MPTATLTFTLPDERHEHLCAVHGQRLAHALREIDERLRQLLKHGRIAEYTAERLAEEIRQEIGEVLDLVPEA